MRTGESFALPRRSAVRELSPACRTEPGHRSGVWVASRATRSRVHRSTPAHPPVAALLPLGGALGWFPAVAPMVQQGQPRTVGREGDKSLEAVPRPWLTFNLAQMHRGVDKIRPRSAGYPFPRVLSYPPPRRPSEIPTSGGFRFVGPRIQFRDYVAIFSLDVCWVFARNRVVCSKVNYQ